MVIIQENNPKPYRLNGSGSVIRIGFPFDLVLIHGNIVTLTACQYHADIITACNEDVKLGTLNCLLLMSHLKVG